MRPARPPVTMIGFLLFAVAVGFLVVGLWLDLAVNDVARGEASHWSDAFWPAAFLGFPAVGALILARLPRSAIGWMLCGIGVSISLAIFTAEYAQYALLESDEVVPGGRFAAWFGSWIHLVAVACLLLLLIVFPSGQSRNAFWRWVARLVVGVSALMAALYALRPGPLDSLREVSNPSGVEGLGDMADAVIPQLGAFLAVALVATIIDKVWVFVGSRGAERQQIKWFALSALLFPLLFAVTLILEEVIGRDRFGDFDPVVMAFFVGFNGLAVAIGLAVFKYRLYDIDLVVNRTLVYGAITAILAAAYAGLVFAFQTVLSPFTAESDLAIAASTLAVAALFQPLRNRIQTFIDRRFYRGKFDAQQTLEMFSASLRDEVDLLALSDQLVEVVRQTMQPSHVSLWVRTSRAEMP